MELILPELRLPELELQYIIDNHQKYFRVVSSVLDPVFIHLLKTGKIRVQIWLERELRKRSRNIIKRSWVHSIDNSNNAPVKLFTRSQYNYGDGFGWGWGVRNIIPPYSTTNGFAPSEFEVTSDHIIDGQIKIKINILDIFTNIIKFRSQNIYATTGNAIESLEILGRHRMNNQPIRVKLVVNYQGNAQISSPSNPMILGIHKNRLKPTFNPSQIGSHMKVSYYK